MTDQIQRLGQQQSAPAQPANLDGERQRHREQNDDRDHGRAPDRAAAPAEALFVPVYAAH